MLKLRELSPKKIVVILSLSVLVLTACVKPQSSENTFSNNPSNSGNISANNVTNSSPEVKTTDSKSTAAKIFLGYLSGKRVEIVLLREGNNLSGTYKYEKIGKDLKLNGTIDSTGKFTLQEIDQSGSKTGEWKGIWKEADEQATLTGKWKSTKGSEIDFSADELVTNFNSGAKITTKSANEENKAMFYEITAEYPELSGVDAATATNFNQSVKKIVDDNNRGFKDNLGDITTSEDLKRYKEDGISLYDETSYDLKMANDDVISVIFTDASFQGGAHGSSASITLNFDVKNNRLLKLADIFEPNSNYLKMLSDLSRSVLKAKLQKDDMLDEGMLNDGLNPKEENFKSWNLTKKGLLITFDAYQVAAYAAGPQEVVIPYTKLQSILMKNSIVAKSSTFSGNK